jgi:hypothetical protein
MDILIALDNVLVNVPNTSLMCPPLRRKLIADAAAEIRTQRGQLATARERQFSAMVVHDATSPGKTRPAAVLIGEVES